MAEQISPEAYAVLKRLPHPVLKFLKLRYRHRRFKKALAEGKRSFNKYGHLYSYHILLVAGLPKSGTTWVESMLLSYPGYTIIPDPEVIKWGYQHGGSHNFQLSMKYFEDIKGTLALVKEHFPGSTNNTDIIKKLNIPHLILYRDLRDAAVSHVFYVKRTPWHPEYAIYKDMGIKESLLYFASTLLPEWKNWVYNWQVNRDQSLSLIVRYEELRANPLEIFTKIVKHFRLPEDNVENIVKIHQFNNMKKKGSFFRKGKTGDWKNYFDDEIKALFKSTIGDFLIQEGYETDLSW